MRCRRANDHELPHKMNVAPFCFFVFVLLDVFGQANCTLMALPEITRGQLKRVRGFFKVQPEGSYTNPAEG